MIGSLNLSRLPDTGYRTDDRPGHYDDDTGILYKNETVTFNTTEGGVLAQVVGYWSPKAASSDIYYVIVPQDGARWGHRSRRLLAIGTSYAY